MNHGYGDAKGFSADLPEQILKRSPKKRPLSINTDENSAHLQAKKLKGADMNGSSTTPKQSTPLKRSPKREHVVLSDFSDWDESPVKKAPLPSNNGAREAAVIAKENAELNDSFDDPITINSPVKQTASSSIVSPRKRSFALRIPGSVSVESPPTDEPSKEETPLSLLIAVLVDFHP